MMTLLSGYLCRWQQTVERITSDPELRSLLYSVGAFLAGLCLSAASLAGTLQPFCLSVLCAGLPGWLPMWYALGGALGYWLFWGMKGLQGVLWIAASLPVCVLVARQRRLERVELLLPSFAALIVAACGVIFQTWRGEDTPIAVYLLRVGLSFGGVWILQLIRTRGEKLAQWTASGICVLALAQIAPVAWLDLGMVAAALTVANLPLPAVAIAGLALDLAQITPVPMTAVLCLGALLRLLPGMRRGWMAMLPAAMYLAMMTLCGQTDLLPLPALLLGGVIGAVLPGKRQFSHRRGETGFAQVRLEMAAGAMAQSEQLLQAIDAHPIDETALMEKAVDRACSGCPARKSCKEAEQGCVLPDSLLHRAQIQLDDLPVDCRKRSRLLQELRRSQDQLRTLQADRQRRQEYRSAVIQQYHFLSEYLQDLADRLPRREESRPQRFRPEVAVCSAGREGANGDRCFWFAGTDCRYYLLLCDGMGTGADAAQEAKAAGSMLRRLLMAGYPASYAMRSVNSLCTLRGRAGAVTMDLAEFRLDTGKVSVYKWGAAPSWLLLPTGAEKVGTGGMPPGMSVTDARETVENFTMRRGEVLVLFSDGVDPAAALQEPVQLWKESPGALAARLLERGRGSAMDDATAAVIRLDAV